MTPTTVFRHYLESFRQLAIADSNLNQEELDTSLQAIIKDLDGLDFHYSSPLQLANTELPHINRRLTEKICNLYLHGFCFRQELISLLSLLP